MKLIFLSIMLCLFSVMNAQTVASKHTIGSIEKRSNWYDIYNERGKKIKTIHAGIGELVGFGSHFFIVKRGNWYDLYNETGTKYKTLPVSTGEIVSVAGGTFTVRRGAWLYACDSMGKKISARQAK
ncbi:MAG: hypothetical protein LBF85_09815 [Tannerella sp.]|jgi:hypothetical protein|nr:hypothetical protein [Tannerella sp.]